MNMKLTVQWVVTSAVRLLAGYFAVKLGADAAMEQGWTSLSEGLVAATIAGISMYSSLKARKKLLEAQPPAGK